MDEDPIHIIHVPRRGQYGGRMRRETGDDRVEGFG